MLLNESDMCCENTCCSSVGRVEEEFIDKIAEIVIKIFNVPSYDHRLVHPMLVNLLSKKLNNSYPYNELGLLQLFEKHIVNEIGKSLTIEFGLEETKPNHNYGTHAKMNDIVEAIKLKYNIAQDLGYIRPGCEKKSLVFKKSKED